MSEQKEIYIGDGVYASYNGWAIKLRVPYGVFDEKNHEIYLEPAVLKNLISYAEECKVLVKE